MECMEAALKSSYKKDMTIKFSPQTLFLDDNVTSCEEFFVDDLLDFSHEEALVEEEKEKEPQQQNHNAFASVSPQNDNQSHETCNLSFSSELTVPDEDAANLERLSHFVEDSVSEYSISLPIVTSTKSLAEKAPEPGSAAPFFKTPIPGKARGKRTRTGVRVWLLRSPSLTQSSSTASSTTTTTTSSVTQTSDHVCSEKKAKRRTMPNGEGCGGAPRRCSHCGVQKTPQWRTGPFGPKTLCNACGVRYKSGRLLPEYRPACSPSFCSELHSNHHRKVLEMRRKKR